MSRRSTAPHGEDGLTSSQAVSPAKTLASPERAQDSTVHAPAFGGKCSASFAKRDPVSSSWRTFQLSLAEGLTAFLGRWPTWGSMRNGACYRRPTAELPISASAGGVLLPTPTQDSATERTSKYKQGGTPLPLAVRMLPTPTVNDANNVTRTSGAFQSLSRAVQQWPTPTTRDAHNNGAPSQLKRNAPPLNAVVGGKLNADWVELLMGWPAGWTSLPPDSGTETGKRSRGSRKGKPTA